MPSTVLITGANRGIGLGLAKSYAAEGYTVIAAVRNVAKMPKIEGNGKVITVKLDSAVPQDATEAMNQLKSQHSIDHLDVVIANAAVNLTFDTFDKASLDDLDQTYQVNIRGPIALFQATKPLLSEKSKFVVISSGAGCIGVPQNPKMGIYGLSKAAMNYFVAKSHAEHPDLTIFGISPGWLDTELGNAGARSGLMMKPTGTVEEAIPQVVKAIDDAGLTMYNGKLVDTYVPGDAVIMPW